MAQGTESILNALLFKEKAKFPGFTELSPQAEQLKSISGNMAALPESSALAAGVNRFNQDQILAMLKEVAPTYEKMLALQSGNIESLLKGEIPDDVGNAIQNSVAARAIGGGIGGSQAHGKVLAKDLGLTSLDLTQKELDSATRWLTSVKQNLTAPIFDVTSMFISPTQQFQMATQERNNLFNYTWAKNQYDVVPEPWERAVGGLMDWVANTALSAAEMYTGQMMGGGMGGMGGGSKNTKQDYNWLEIP